MKKRALRKDFFVEIQRSFNRFASIFVIVALGVAFFAGLQAAAPDMRDSGDAYFDAENLMDLKVVGTLGLTEADVEALEALPGVEDAEGAWMTDVLCGGEAEQKVLRVESVPERFNSLTVTEGELPGDAGECFLDADAARKLGLSVGDAITVEESLGDDEDAALSVHTFTVAGIGSSPEYISYQRGNSTLGSGEVNGVLYVPAESFALSVYTDIWVRAAGAKEQNAFEDAYAELIGQVEEQIEGIEEIRCLARYDEIREEAESEIEAAESEIEAAESELEAGRAEADSELESAKAELESGRVELESAKAELKSGRAELESAKAELKSGKAELESGKTELSDGREQLESAKTELSDGEASLADARAEQASGQSTLDASRAELSTRQAQADSARAQVESGKTQLENAKAALNMQESEYAAGVESADLDGAQTAIDTAQAQLDEKAAQLNEGEAALAAGWQSYEASLAAASAAGEIDAQTQAALDAARTQLETQQGQLETARQQIASGQEQIEQSRTQLESAKNQLAEARAALDAAWAELYRQEETLTASEAQVETAESQLADAWAQLNAGQARADAGSAQIADAQSQLDSGRTQISENERKLAEAESEIAANEQKLSEAESEIAENEKKLSEAESEIAENEQKLADAQKEYDEGKAEAESELSEAESEIADAKEKLSDAKASLADLEVPEWTVTNREDDTDYQGYGDNADRMTSLAQVFPALFFLVAALISLTTMTRMVEEERTQIGTLKALGYGKGSIAAKYLCYALLATLGGGILGVLFGQKFLPYVIIKAYGMLYLHMNVVRLPYRPDSAGAALMIAVLCTTLAALFSCVSTLADTPASLMRPPAPKQGKRVFLERIGILWRHLSFSWKSTVRNLFRYKKRFFMTIFGIGGCMALLLVGFGLRDSIMDVAVLQYQELQLYDGTLILEDGASDEEKRELTDRMEESGHVTAWKDVYMKAVQMGGGTRHYEVYLIVPETLDDLADFVVFRDRNTHEEYTLGDEGVILSEKTASLFDVGPGDTFEIQNGDAGTVTVKVSAVCENYMLHYCYMSEACYEEVFGERPSFDDRLFVTDLEEQAQIEQLGTDFLKADAALSISYTATVKGQVDEMLSTLDSVLYVLIIAAGLLAFVVLYNLNNININERRRELATIKVLGFYDGEVSAYVYRENILLTLIGVALGVFLGFLLHRYVILTVEVDNCMFGRSIKPLSDVLAMVITFGFSAFVNVVMHFKLKKIDMVESLKSVE